MFEAHVLHLLRKYLGEYVHGLSLDALRISVWKGDVVLKDLKLKAEALNSLKLPVTVRAGFVGSITLKVPWKSLGKEPVIVLIDRVFVLAHPAPAGWSHKEEDRNKLFEAKLQHIEEAEAATLEAISRSKLGSQLPGNSWLGSLISTIIGNLKISISNVHVRYEDSVSNPGHPFSMGITLAKLAAVTMDEEGNETFDTSGALDKLRKLLQLERLAMYHNSDSHPWDLDKRWEDLNPSEWIKIFEDGIHEATTGSRRDSKWAENRNYVVSPINGALKYHRLGNQERNDPEIPFEKAALVLSDVSLTIAEAQYHDWIKFFEVVSRYKAYIEVSHLRPLVPVAENPFLWWRYAAQATLQQKKLCYRFSWERIRHLCELRRRYIQLYAASLQKLSNVDSKEIRNIEKNLDSKVILLWRLLAHAKVESVKSKEAAEQRQLQRRWFSFRWSAPPEDASEGDSSEELRFTEGRLTKEEWQAINNLLSYQPDDELTTNSGKDSYLVTVSIGQAAARIINSCQTEIVCGRFEQLLISTKIKSHSTRCDISLKFYGLSAPEGSIAQSVSSEQKVNALAASFVYLPVGENVDWKLSATISPCHVTVLMESYNRFLEFLKRSSAFSPALALETATVLQKKIEKVTRRAQEQIQMVLEEKSSFALDIDFDAPKVRVPIRASGPSKCDSHFLLDFGHFTLQTADNHSEEQRKNLYSQFHISGRDIAVFFMDCSADSFSWSLVGPNYDKEQMVSPTPEKFDGFYSVIDPCGIKVIVDQINIPHPSYPSTRISVQVPNLGIHFSPVRYCRLMELLKTLYEDAHEQQTAEDFQSELACWSPADMATDARILVWKGIGNSVATWHPCFLVLSGTYLYLLESEKSQSYHRFLSMAGKQVCDIPLTNVGGSPYCLAVSSRGMDIQKALESSSTWVIEFCNEEGKATWFKGLIQATYQASAPPSVDVFGETNAGIAESSESRASNASTADLIINGALVETKLFIYGMTGDKVDEDVEETPILEVLAGGGKVHVLSCEGDLAVKMKLHSLKIKDELQSRHSINPQYLACSVVKIDPDSCVTQKSNGKEMSMVFNEDDDIFTDALPDFMLLSEPGAYTQSMDITQHGRLEETGEYAGLESVKALARDRDVGKGQGVPSEIFYEAQGSDFSDFVSVTFSRRSSASPGYDGVDTQMSICMSKLEFFCNRPTLVALINFGFNLNSGYNATVLEDMAATSDDTSQINKEKGDDSGRVQGLLGYGKNRVVFNLSMNVDNVTVFLNKEDGSQLAMLVQESFLFDLKVHPSSVSIEGTLGNFRLCDMSLGMDNCWRWLCDIRNPGVDSLIKFKFDSYSPGDDDFEGYDYRLCGRLSAVRLVFLYRFVKELSVYFMELATPHTEEAIKLVDKVGDFEWLINKYEIDGATALKLDLAFDTPIIIVPRNSMSRDFIQLDLGQLRVSNDFSWHGCPDKDPSAVHVDVLHAEISGINMCIGINGCIGKPMIQEGQGLDIFVRRSLRDVFKKVPSFSFEVKVGSLHCMMSDKEYSIILDCLYLNLYEEPRLPPSFRGSSSGSKDTIRLLADKVNLNSQLLLSRTVTIFAVEVDYALLELYHCTHEDLPLAHVILEGLWVFYRMTALSEADLYVTIPKFSVLDIRPDTKSEMRLMLGSSADAFKQASAGKFSSPLSRNRFRRTSSEDDRDVLPISTMFLMDYRWRMSSQSFVVRVQQPRVLFVPDFLLTVAEFFVPALKSVTGREEKMDPGNDPINKNNCIVLSEHLYKQGEDIVRLSPNRQLVADAPGIDEYTYDGCGKIICLDEETDSKNFYSVKSRPIVIIGRGKRLRFVNVKIENGSLLRKYAYLSNDSSYSVSPEDGVDIVLLESSSSDDEKKSLDYMQESSGILNDPNSQNESNGTAGLTFEAQVVQPEFTFYDDTKSALENVSYGEKLLRAKMDLSFMYASKGNDMWIRALVKDMTVEAGSGLTILDPVDISAGYTSIKEKTSITLTSTDIYVRLSLSAISLILNLQNQAAEALQFGNAVPLVLCTNFERIWVSPKEGPYKSLTFWRPRAPSNYVILGDCVTSRPIPPSQAVMAICNTYGRVRKPIGFNLIAVFSAKFVLEEESHADFRDECSLWMPIAPPGYISVGCVAHIGRQLPPNYAVHCLRADLVTSAMYSECIFSAPPSSWFASGFSIWRLDNVLGSFYAHPSTECAPKGKIYDLSHLLMWNSNRCYSSSKEPGSVSPINHDIRSEETSNQGKISSGWEVVRSISKAGKYFVSTPNFERVWWDKGSDLRRPVSIWRPIARPGFAAVGDCIIEGLEPPALGIVFRADDPEISAKPVQFTKVAHIVAKGFDEAFFWYPIAPPGYASLGCVVSRTDQAPSIHLFCCPRLDLVGQANIIEVPISRSASFKSSQCWSIWKVENQACTFLARSDLKKPSSRLAFTIADTVKQKTRENVNAELRLRCLSITVLDSLCGMMTPLVDTTITNIRLATHGQLDAMNAVLVSSMAASTFNTQLEAWEPFVEPFDGIFKFEIYDSNIHSTSRLGKRIRIAATNILNINISSANIETLIQAIASWRRQSEIEMKTAQRRQEAESNSRHARDPTFCALDEEDLQTVIIENKLGCDIYLKKVEETSDGVDLLHHDDCASLWIPPPRFPDRINLADKYREARYYVTVQVLEAKGLPIVDDGNSQNFFCALRLVFDNQTTDQQKLFPQSARTKCVKPLISKLKDQKEGSARWNELFVFEVPCKGLATLEVEVTNLAANAGKGEVVGALSFSVGNDTNTLKKVASGKVVHQPFDVQNIVSYSLKKRNNDVMEVQNDGCLLLSTSYFERKKVENIQEDKERENDLDRDVGLWVSLHPKGAWESIRSLLPLSVVPKRLQDNFIAVEVFMQNGRKHVMFRGLVMVVNDSDVKLDISVRHVASSNRYDPPSGSTSSQWNWTHAKKQLVGQSKDYIDYLISLDPGSSTILPWRCTFGDSKQCLQIRPSAGHLEPAYAWGCTAAVGSGFPSVKEDSFMDPASQSREGVWKQGNKLPNSLFMLHQLEKKDVLLFCDSDARKRFWLAAGADASVLHTEMNAPVYDWKISINSPLKLENRLPCPVEFTILEKTKEGRSIQRQCGTISSRKSVHIYSADVQRPVYVTLFVQGGWVLEKDPIVLMDLSSNDRVSSFWLVHPQNKRRLRVSIEHDMGGTITAPKTIRFFVPYWIVNDSSLPLAYRVVEIEPLDSAETDSSISRAVKSARTSFKNPTLLMERIQSSSRRSVQVLEAIEDSSPVPAMLSPQDYGSRTLFPSQKGSYPLTRVGISVAMRDSDIYCPGISLFELEKKQRVGVNAFGSDGSYYKLSTLLNMTSDRTKVIHFQPHTLFVNRVGCRLCIQQCDSSSEEWIHPSDPPRPFEWKSSTAVEMLKLRLDGYKWSTPFSVCHEGVMRVSLKKDTGNDQIQLRVEVRSGSKSSHYEVIFRPNSTSSPYRIENRSVFLPIYYRQADGTADTWQVLLPNTAASFLWEDLGRRRLLELLLDVNDPLKSQKYNIDEVSDHLPIHFSGGPVRSLRVTIVKEEKINVVKVSDWMPENEPSAIISGETSSSLSQTPANDIDQQPPDCEFHIIVELSELGISIVDHTPEEILYLSVQSLLVAYSTGLGSGISRFKLRMCGIQVDNQLPLTPMPVLFRPQRSKEDTDLILKLSLTMQSNGLLDLCVYPYIGFQGPENSAFLINIHEPVIWRLHEMMKQIDLSRIYGSATSAVSVDPIIQIGVLNISEIRFKVSVAMSPSQRPRGVLGFWLSLMTALGNTENMPVRINQKFKENVSMRQTSIISNAILNIKKDLLGQPLQLLSGVDILGNASSALGHMSKGVAALSMDKKFIQSRQRQQENKGVEDFGDVIREGGGALAKGLFRGVTGILTKPLEGARTSGVEGFVQGVGKGIIGAAAQPVSGVLDLLSKTTEGANAMRMKIASAITSDEQLLRRRLPRVISGDNLLRLYDEYRAQGQVMLQLAESGSFLGQVDLFKVRGKFALSDAYEDHFLLPKAKVLVVTHRRVLLLQQPFNIIAQRKFSPAKDPCSVLWEVLWDDLVTMEFTYGKKDTAQPSRLILHLVAKSADLRGQFHVVKCIPGTTQAMDVYTSIERAVKTYGPNSSKDLLNSKVTKPYSPVTHGNPVEVIPRDGAAMWSPQHVPQSSTFGSRTS